MHLLVRHKVADFVRWIDLFDSHLEAQREAGIELKNMWRNVDEPEEVILLFEVDDLEAAKEFAYSDEVPDAKNASEVVDEPDIYFLE